jgi:hypothetical protein
MRVNVSEALAVELVPERPSPRIGKKGLPFTGSEDRPKRIKHDHELLYGAANEYALIRLFSAFDSDLVPRFALDFNRLDNDASGTVTSKPDKISSLSQLFPPNQPLSSKLAIESGNKRIWILLDVPGSRQHSSQCALHRVLNRPISSSCARLQQR